MCMITHFMHLMKCTTTVTLTVGQSHCAKCEKERFGRIGSPCSDPGNVTEPVVTSSQIAFRYSSDVEGPIIDKNTIIFLHARGRSHRL